MLFPFLNFKVYFKKKRLKKSSLSVSFFGRVHALLKFPLNGRVHTLLKFPLNGKVHTLSKFPL